MLTDMMTTQEWLREIRRDRELLLRRLSHEEPKWRRWLLKHKGCERVVSDKWTCPESRNQHVWAARIHSTKTGDYGLSDGILRWRNEGMEFVMHLPGDADYGRFGSQVFAWQDTIGGRDTLIQFTPHCWQRVRERMPGMHQYYGADLVQRAIYVASHGVCIISDSSEGQNREGQRIENPLRITTRTGIFLGEKLNQQHYLMRTYIAHQQTSGEQQQVTAKWRDSIRKATDGYRYEDRSKADGW